MWEVGWWRAERQSGRGLGILEGLAIRANWDIGRGRRVGGVGWQVQGYGEGG